MRRTELVQFLSQGRPDQQGQLRFDTFFSFYFALFASSLPLNTLVSVLRGWLKQQRTVQHHPLA